jgi:hypothetical protein
VRLSSEPKVLGAAVLARQRANEAIVGRGVVEAAVAKLDAELAALWRGVTAMTWVDLEALEQIQDAIAREAGRDPEELHDQVIRRSVDDALKTVYRIVLRHASDHWLVSRTSTMFKKTRSVGNLTSSIPEPGCAELELTDWPGIRERYLRQIAIGIERVLTLCGREDVRVRYTRTPVGAEFAASWTP